MLMRLSDPVAFGSHIVPNAVLVKPSRSRAEPCSLMVTVVAADRCRRNVKCQNSGKTIAEARQGDRRVGNFRVAIVSTLAVIALFATVFLVFFANAPVSVPGP